MSQIIFQLKVNWIPSTETKSLFPSIIHNWDKNTSGNDVTLFSVIFQDILIVTNFVLVILSWVKQWCDSAIYFKYYWNTMHQVRRYKFSLLLTKVYITTFCFNSNYHFLFGNSNLQNQLSISLLVVTVLSQLPASSSYHIAKFL